jgi:GDPmannose 4,6-dehydratase
METKKALITGVTGQDGSYLVELLLEEGYEVHGIIRRSSTFNTSRIDHLLIDEKKDPTTKFFIHYGDLSDSSVIYKLIRNIEPCEIYNLAAQSHVGVSFDIPEYTADIVGLGVLRILEAIRDINPKIKFYQASSSEMFGSSLPPQNENTTFRPRSPYAVAKVFSYHLTEHYRESYGIFACNGILFNHESERRGKTFVTRKITESIARIKIGLDKKLYLGNLDAKRDWGYAPEYVEAMYRIMHYHKPDNFVIATGEMHSVKEFLEEAFNYAGLGNWQKYVEIDSRYFRPHEVDSLCGDYSKAKEKLGWEPKVKFKELVRIMVDNSFKDLK